MLERGIIYAERPGYRALELDVHRDPTAGAARPLLVNVHGGGWRVSNRQRPPRETRGWDRSFHERMVDDGFVVACPSYRLSAEAQYPAAIHDVVDAVTYLRGHADDHGIDADRIVLFGQSAGGYLAAAAGLRAAPATIRGVVCWYPLTDFSAFGDDDPASVFPSYWLGGPLSVMATLVEDSRLPRLVHGAAPPFLLQHGTADMMAPYDQSVRLHEALAGVGVHVELDRVDGAAHFFGGADDATVRALFDRAMAFARGCVA
jgi:acetyl esterase/lipase